VPVIATDDLNHALAGLRELGCVDDEGAHRIEGSFVCALVCTVALIDESHWCRIPQVTLRERSGQNVDLLHVARLAGVADT